MRFIMSSSVLMNRVCLHLRSYKKFQLNAKCELLFYLNSSRTYSEFVFPPIFHFKNRNFISSINRIISKYQQCNTIDSKSFYSETESKKLKTIINLIHRFNSIQESINSLEELKNDQRVDETFSKLLITELKYYQQKLCTTEDELIYELISLEEGEVINDVVLEVTAGVGGQEAMLFAQKLNMLYTNYTNFNNWTYDVVNFEQSDIGGLKHCTILVSGKNCFKFLQLEGGVHRVQRIPQTEKYSRMHTSTAIVTVYPKPSEIDVKIDKDDLRIETKTARGPGGQHVNKIQTAVRLHHITSGIIVDCQTHRSQYQNKKIALEKLRLKLFKIQLEEKTSSVKKVRKSQAGTKSRNEKIRTYNFNQNRVTDHRYDVSVSNLEKYFEGKVYFHNFLQQLLNVHYEFRKKEFLNGN